MDTVEFFKTVNRLCKNRSRAECPICKKSKIKDMCMVMRTVMLGDASVESIEKMISIVEQLAKDHTVKTRQSEFLNMFPNAQIDTYGALTIRPCSIEKGLCSKCTTLSDCVDCRREYWLTEAPDND